VNIQEYIDSGILEQYCLCILTDDQVREVDAMRSEYPEIEAEVTEIESSLYGYVSAVAQKPSAELRHEIWSTLENLNKEREIDLSDLPVINKYTDHNAWLGIVKPFIPAHLEEDRIVRVLRETDDIVQMLLVSKTDFVNEVHVEEYESFIILEGECECTVGEKVFRLQAGGFTEIPLHTSHDVRILTPHVTAILQRIAV
jgi:mannose-6-phosphate isomerase-like protein (cupin superfamily)